MLEGAKVLITGLTGQVGAAIAAAHAGRCEMWGLARFTRPGSREACEALGVHPVHADLALGDFEAVPDDFDYVLHFAAKTRPGSAEVGMVQNAEATGLLMHHCRKAKAFLHVGTNAVYMDNTDPHHIYRETDHLGGSTPRAPNYGATKVAAEGVARTLARLYKLPTTIARLNVPYGAAFDGLPGRQLQDMIDGNPINVPTRPCFHAPIHEDDLAAHIEPLLRAAAVPAVVVNWGGDEGVNVVEWVNYLGEITGLTPRFNFTDVKALPNFISDTSRGREIGLTWKVHWKDGMRRMVQARHPEIQLRDPAGV